MRLTLGSARYKSRSEEKPRTRLHAIYRLICPREARGKLWLRTAEGKFIEKKVTLRNKEKFDFFGFSRKKSVFSKFWDNLKNVKKVSNRFFFVFSQKKSNFLSRKMARIRRVQILSFLWFFFQISDDVSRFVIDATEINDLSPRKKSVGNAAIPYVSLSSISDISRRGWCCVYVNFEMSASMDEIMSSWSEFLRVISDMCVNFRHIRGNLPKAQIEKRKKMKRKKRKRRIMQASVTISRFDDDDVAKDLRSDPIGFLYPQHSYDSRVR